VAVQFSTRSVFFSANIRTTTRAGHAFVALATLFMGGCSSSAINPVHGTFISSTSYLNFGAMTLGLSSDQELKITQQGRVAVELAGVQVDPPDAAFQVSTVPQRLGLGGEAVLKVRYLPRVAGRNLSVLHLLQRNGPEVQVTLDGRGVDARAVPENRLEFGRPAIGDARQRFLRLRNDAETAVPVQLLMSGPDAPEFWISSDVVVPAFSSVEVNSWYHPVAKAGARQVSVMMIGCPLCTREKLPVSADAVLAPIVVTPDPVDMGDVAVDTQRRRQVQITNATDEMITLLGVELLPGSDPGFQLDPAQLPVRLLPLLPEVMGLTFSPTSLSPANGVLHITSDAVPTPEMVVAIRAGAGGAQLVVTPQQLNFRSVPAGGRGAATFTVENGAADMTSPPLHILGITVNSGPFDVAQGIPPGTALAAGQRQVVTMGFAPTAVGPFHGSVTVTSDDPINPSVTLALDGVGTSNVSCVLESTPASLDFGGVPLGKAAVLGAKITNVGTDPCSLWDETVTGDTAFTIQKPRALMALNPGEDFVATITFRPAASTRVTGLLEFQTSRANQVALDIPLAGGADSAQCLSIDPGDIYFGDSNQMACPSMDQATTVVNECAQPVVVTSVAFGPGTEAGTFSLANAIATPQTLQPGEGLPITVHMEPLKPGYSVWPLFVTASDSMIPHLIPVAGEILPHLPLEQTFVQTQPGKLDLLWVIDNTESMRNKRASLAASIGHFLQTLDAMGVDYHMGVTTTGIDPAPPSNGTAACPGGVNGGEAGRLFPVDHSSPRIIDSTMADRAQVLADNVNVGGCHSIQQGLLASDLALSPPNVDNDDNVHTPQPDDGNLGLVREDASLAVVVVSDQDDGSPGSADDNARTLLTLKPETPMTFSAIITPAQGCSIGTQPGTRYLEAVAQVGGATASVCDADWSRSLDTIASGVFRSRDTFPLAQAADPASLVVQLDGQPASGWRYEPSTHSVIFSTAPVAGARISVKYLAPCGAP
jgi:hypothetical protein